MKKVREGKQPDGAKPKAKTRWRWLRWGLGGGLLLLFVPLLAMVLYGLILSHGTADVIVVPGAALRAGGTELSDALRYRMNTAVQLYKEGVAPKLLFSGGGEGAWSEAHAMARYAQAQGVPADAIVLDERGDNTRATANRAAEIMREHKLQRALFISNWYHVCRGRLALAQAGVEAEGAACEHPNFLFKEAQYTLREVVALYAYLVNIE